MGHKCDCLKTKTERIIICLKIHRIPIRKMKTVSCSEEIHLFQELETREESILDSWSAKSSALFEPQLTFAAGFLHLTLANRFFSHYDFLHKNALEKKVVQLVVRSQAYCQQLDFPGSFRKGGLRGRGMRGIGGQLGLGRQVHSCNH